MIIRIVKMSFKPEKVEEFKKLFNLYKSQIANADGCLGLELLQERDATVFFTYSVWKENSYLEKYRESDLFDTVWSQTKTFFNAKPEAWTTQMLYNSKQAI
ncbi:MAG TPA: antibiotic biosynthesis monooxygenase [Bacteroidia bacterium]|nr:antibiotic biosynthesis monooxygenase [Bacteroidia bacterium]